MVGISPHLRERTLSRLFSGLLPQTPPPLLGCLCYRHISRVFALFPGCGVKYAKMGCYSDDGNNPRPLPEELFTDQSPTSPMFTGQHVDYENWDQYLPNIVCRCAEMTEKKGYKVFGLQMFGNYNQFPLTITLMVVALFSSLLCVILKLFFLSWDTLSHISAHLDIHRRLSFKPPSRIRPPHQDIRNAFND